MRFGARSKENQIGPGLPWSVNGGLFALGFSPSSVLFSGPGSLLLIPSRPATCSARVCAIALALIKPAPASAAAPANIRRETDGSGFARLSSFDWCVSDSLIVFTEDLLSISGSSPRYGRIILAFSQSSQPRFSYRCFHTRQTGPGGIQRISLPIGCIK